MNLWTSKNSQLAVSSKVESTESLEFYETIVTDGLQSADKALFEIKKNKLYTQRGFTSFREYVKHTYNYSLSRVERQLTHVELSDLLEHETGTAPERESHTRALANLSTEKKVEVWSQVQDRVKVTEEPVTAGLIHEVKTQGSASQVKTNTFLKTLARVISDYREASTVSDTEREELRVTIKTFLREVDVDCGILEAA
jgi:hypothetical protein